MGWWAPLLIPCFSFLGVLSHVVLLSHTSVPHPETCLTHHRSLASCSFVHLSYWLLVSLSPPTFLGIPLVLTVPGTLEHRVISLCSNPWPPILLPFRLTLQLFIFFTLPWRLPPGFTCCQTASSQWGRSRRRVLLPGPSSWQEARWSCWERPVESGTCRPCQGETPGVSSPVHNFPGWLSGSADSCRPQLWLITEVILGGGRAHFWNRKRGAAASVLTPLAYLTFLSHPGWVTQTAAACEEQLDRLWEKFILLPHWAL